LALLIVIIKLRVLDLTAFCSRYQEIKKNAHSHNFFVYSTFLMAFVVMSPVVNYLNFRGIYIIIALFIVIFFISTMKRKRLKWWFVLLASPMLITSSITSLYWEDARYMLSLVFFIFSLYMLQYLNIKDVGKVVDVASWFLLLVIAMAVVGFIIALVGFDPLLEFPNPDGRSNYLFYTTLSNAYFGNFIRPSGIYDEPGALSFYICFVAAMRHLLKRDNKLTWALLTLGFITLSLAHFIYFIFHLSAERIDRRNLLRFLIVGSLVVFIALSTGFHQIFSDKLVSRLAVTDNGTIVGDNRSFRALNVIDLISQKTYVIWYGADPSCRFEYKVCKQKFPMMGENPLAPMALEGLLVSWPYYLIVISLLVSPIFGRRYLVCMGIGLLLMQRPSVTSMSAAMVTVLVVFLMINSISLYTRYAKKNSKNCIN